MSEVRTLRHTRHYCNFTRYEVSKSNHLTYLKDSSLSSQEENHKIPVIKVYRKHCDLHCWMPLKNHCKSNQLKMDRSKQTLSTGTSFPRYKSHGFLPPRPFKQLVYCRINGIEDLQMRSQAISCFQPRLFIKLGGILFY